MTMTKDELAAKLADGGLPDGDMLSSRKQLLCMIQPGWRSVVYTGNDDDVTLRVFYGRKFMGTKFWLDQGTQDGEFDVTMLSPTGSGCGWWIKDAVVRFFDPNAARLLGSVRSKVERYVRDDGHDYDHSPATLARAMGATVVVESHRVEGQRHLNCYLREAANA